DAAIWNGALWLAHRGGVSQLDATDRHTLAYWPTPQSAAGRRFALARSPAYRLLVADNAAGDSARLLEPANPAAQGSAELPAGDAVAAFRAAYHDSEWHFELGTAPRLTWRGQLSGLQIGRFAQDYFYSFLLSGSDLWTPTPAGLVRNRRENGQLAVADVLPAPEGSRIVQVTTSKGKGAAQAVSDAGAVFEWQPEERKWAPADPAVAPQRVLVDDPLWRWTRSIVVPPGKPWTARTELLVKVAAESAVEPILSDGRFAFDDLDVGLIDGDDLWLAGRGGIVRRRAADGAMLRWYRSAAAGMDSRPLNDVVALRRFTTSGDPLPSSAADADRDAARLCALDVSGQVWEFDGGNPGVWMAAADNPWRGPNGRWLVRTNFLEAAQDVQGRITLGYRGWTPLLPDVATGPVQVLSGGRFSADVVRGVAFLADRGFLATPAGIVEVDREGRYLRLWAAASGNNAAASSPWQDLVVKSGEDRLYASGPDDQALEFAPDTAVWKVRAADSEFCAAVDVRHRDDFWCWSRWNGRLRVQLLKADAQGDDWPLFVQGRFSFDVLRNFRLAGPDLWATTPGGVVQFRREDMQILDVSRTAQDWETEQPVPLRGAEQFTTGEPLACYGATLQYERRGDRWLRLPAGPVATAAETSYEDAARRWQLKPLSLDEGSTAGTAGGFLVQYFEPSGALRINSPILRHVPSSRLRGVVAADGRLWICLDHGLYVYDPR
ncbi:MAG: hypothetical protein NTY19_49810, partial [Planctomycetota bacterium]|nr:hypothetical protein [Planctomycetota bacterium]